jgi:hypothetical protein
VKVIAALAAAALLTTPARAADRPPLAVDASVSPASVLFGDPADVAVQVLVDDDRVNPATVSLEADAEPLARVGRVHRDAWESGGLAYVRFRFRVACAEDSCLAGAQPLRMRPQAMRVAGRGNDGRNVAIRVPWPRLEVGRRVTAAALGGTPAFAVDDSPRAVSWRTAPGPLSSVLTIVAVLLLASAAALVAAEALRVRRRRSAATLDTLEAALAELRGARDVRTRRRAAGRLARILDGSVAPEATRLAWSEEPPAQDAAQALAERIEREVAT